MGPESIDILTEDIGFCLRNIRHPECTLRYAGRFYEELCQKCRARGILRLLLNADSDGFFHDLIESGRAWRHFLARCASEGYSDFYMASSRFEPFLDAMAAKDLLLADAIAALSPKACLAGDEYEDDFCYARFFHCWVQEDAAAAAVLDQFKRALSGSSSARLDICLALQTGAPEMFDAAFRALLEERELELRQERGPRTIIVETNRSIFTEGLGVLRLAEMRGLVTQPEYPMCPALARSLMKQPPPMGSFEDNH